MVLPLPVGPVTSTIPLGRSIIRESSASGPGASPSSDVPRSALDLSSTRRTTFSPWMVGKVETRRSYSFPAIVIRARPSCGSRRSEMSSCAMIFTRDTTEAWIDFDWIEASRRIPSTR